MRQQLMKLIFMNHPKCKKILFLAICLLIMSCVTIDYYQNFWYRHNEHSTYFKKKYEPIDNIKINSLILCKRGEKVHRSVKSKGILSIEIQDIEKNIVSELKKHFNNVDYNIKEDTLTKYNCGFLNKKNILSGIYKPNFKADDIHSANITFEIVLKSYRDNYKDGFYGGTGLLDNDKHIVKFVFRFALFYGKELIYMDNYVYSKAMISEINKNVEYQIPKGIVDTLVNKSLIEFHKRLE